MRRRWDEAALADPRFMVVDAQSAEPLGRNLTPDDAVAMWSAAVADSIAAGDEADSVS